MIHISQKDQSPIDNPFVVFAFNYFGYNSILNEIYYYECHEEFCKDIQFLNPAYHEDEERYTKMEDGNNRPIRFQFEKNLIPVTP